jgi:hypothetical protein
MEHVSISNNFMKRTPMAQQLRERITKWDYRKQNKTKKTFCIAREQSPD